MPAANFRRKSGEVYSVEVGEHDTLRNIVPREQHDAGGDFLISIKNHDSRPREPIVSDHLTKCKADRRGPTRYSLNPQDQILTMNIQNLVQQSSCLCVLDKYINLRVTFVIQFGHSEVWCHTFYHLPLC